MEDSKGRSNPSKPAPEEGNGVPAEDDDITRVVSPGGDDETRVTILPDDDDTRLMSPGEAEKTSVMPSPAGEETRVMPTDPDSQDAPVGSPEDDDATIVTISANEPGDPGATRGMPGAPDPGDQTGPAIADVSAERDPGKRTIKDRFVLETILGAGGMGSVYKAKDLRKVEAHDRNPWVALKLLNEDFKTHPASFMSLQREARKSQDLAHPNIVQVFDFDREGDTVYMTMELLQGNDLNHYIKNHPDGIELEEVQRLTREMGAALQHAHAHDITHADFKPANVFLNEKGTAKVLDFGIAQAVAHAEVGSAKDDKTAFDPGSLGALTPAYASLEMLQGMDPLPADDVFALGCIVYQLLCGRHPYGKKPADEALARGMRPEKIAKLNRRQWRALQKAVALERADRCQTVQEFQQEFAPWENPWAKRLGVAIAVALVLGGIGIYQWVANRQDIAEADKIATAAAAELALEKKKGEVADALDGKLSDLQKNAEDLKKKLQRHRSDFNPGIAWREGVDRDLADLKQLYQADDWMGSLPHSDTLDAAVVDSFRQDAQAERADAGESVEDWIATYEKSVAQEYLRSASAAANDDNFADARALIAQAEKLNPDPPRLLEANRELEELVVANRRENEEIARIAREAKMEHDRLLLEERFQETDAAILTDLQTCTATLSMTGRGGNFSYNIAGLQQNIAALRRDYAALGETTGAAVDGYVEQLGYCIQVFGYADPAGARQQMSTAIQSFPQYAESLSNIPIRPWNTCKSSFSGRGERYDCQDRFLGESRKGPVLVVIPSTEGIAEFAIGKYEISHGEFNEWCRSTGACQESDASLEELPATGLSIEQVSNYTAWLSESTGFRYQLPTVEQWRYAADANGSELDEGRNCTLQSRNISLGARPLPIDQGDSNDWGLVHHVGNAQEVVVSPGGWQAAGSAHTDPMDDCTAQAIKPIDENGDSVTGFRVVRTLE